jgi:hypothetical protein
MTRGEVSDKLDVYAFAVVLVELLTSKSGSEVAKLHSDEPDLFADMAQYADARAGEWPATTVAALAAIAEQCIAYHARSRPAASAVARRLEALLV